MTRVSALISASLISAALTSASQPPATLYIGHATLYSSPTAAPLQDAVITVRDGLIAGVGSGSQVEIPPGARIIDARGGVVVAGFQNSHIHFSEPQWARGATQRAAVFSSQFEAMFTRFGFTTVVDTGSSLEDARAIRDRVARGEVTGPRVLTAGIPLYPASAVPYYVRESVPPDVLSRLHQPAAPTAARQIATANIDGGADIVKLFTGSWVTNEQAVPMRREIARAAVEAAHERRKLVFSHASNIEGLQVAIDAGVDVVAHVIDDTRGLTARHFEQMVARRMALVPTLTVVGGKAETLDEVRQFRQAGGQVLFGTDAGFIRTYDPTEEYGWLSRAGLSWRDILASLTVNPAARFGESGGRGEVAAGMAADLVILRGDPSRDVRALADVRMTIRGGAVIYDGGR